MIYVVTEKGSDWGYDGENSVEFETTVLVRAFATRDIALVFLGARNGNGDVVEIPFGDEQG